jgi:hypothetical protein
MFDAGFNVVLEPGLAETKRPRFSHNSDFNFGVFGESFDFLVARSIWTHASKQQICAMLDGFVRHGSRDGVFLTSRIRTRYFKKRDYKGGSWVGKSHESTTQGTVAHKRRWIQNECSRRGLRAEEIRGAEYNFGKQIWMRIGHRD